MTNSTKNARFAHGSGVYACTCCGRSTRSTGRGDNELMKMCAECYDLGGEENSLSDTGDLYDTPQNVLAMIATVAEKGGDASQWDDLKAVAESKLPKTEETVTTPVAVETPAKDVAVEHFLTIDAACKMIRASRNRAIHIAVNQHARIEGDENKVFPIYGHIRVTAPAACKFVQDAYKGFEERGARVRISLLGTCMFIG